MSYCREKQLKDSINILAESTPLTVSELTFALKKTIEQNFEHLCIKGEMTNVKKHSSGHLYFDLKDAEAKIAAVMFRGRQGRLSRMPKEGDQVIATGSLSLFPPQGRYQLLVEDLTFAGIGDLLAELEKRKKRLQSLGYFDPARKKPLPTFPQSIGIVTSPTGAVIRDILHVLKRRFDGMHLLLNPVRVQGKGAELEIAAAIDAFNRFQLVDVIIVARGGGSLEDLWPFNEEIVAHSIFKSAIPIISAIGHETDFTLADFVADHRAPTPSAAAEIVSPDKKQLLLSLSHKKAHLGTLLFQRLKATRERFTALLHHPCFLSATFLTQIKMQKIDEARDRLDQAIKKHLTAKHLDILKMQKALAGIHPISRIQSAKQKTKHYESTLTFLMKREVEKKRHKLEHMQKILEGLHPKQVLKRGYSILFAQNTHSIIVSKKELLSANKIRVQLADGEATLDIRPSSQ